MEHPPLERKDSRLAPRASKKKKGRRQKVAEARAEDFIPRVSPISRRSPNREEEEEEEDDMSGLVHNFVARKRKRDASLEQAADAAPEVAGGSGQPCSDGGLKVQAIVISGSPETSLNDYRLWETLPWRSLGRHLQFLLPSRWYILPSRPLVS